MVALITRPRSTALSGTASGRTLAGARVVGIQILSKPGNAD